MHGIDDAGELDHCAVADQLDDAAVVGGDGRVEHGFPVALERGERAGLVGAHHPRIADHVGRKDGRQLTIDARLGHGTHRSSNATQRVQPAEAALIFTGKQAHFEADRRQLVEIGELFHLAITDFAARLVAFPDDARVARFGEALARVTRTARPNSNRPYR